MTLFSRLRAALLPEHSTTPTTVNLHLGDQLRSYRLFATDAPASLDQLGTIEFRSDHPDRRYVLLPEPMAFYWLFSIRQSGFEAAPSGAYTEGQITRTLLKRMGAKRA